MFSLRGACNVKSVFGLIEQLGRRQFHPDKATKPKPGNGKCYRRVVHYEKEYTVKPLNVTNLGGRCPETGHLIAKGIGGGIKHKYHWIKWIREGPASISQEEKVIRIIKCGCRTSDVALVGVKDEMKYILATENMKEGDIIQTSQIIPKNPVKASDGDAHPLGALPIGTKVHNVQLRVNSDTTVVHSAGSFATVKGHLHDNVIVQLPSKREVALNKHCIATVGRLSNVEHSSTPIGSAQKNRELGNRPRSGLWQRKTGRFGRKIKLPKKLKVIDGSVMEKPEFLRL